MHIALPCVTILEFREAGVKGGGGGGGGWVGGGGGGGGGCFYINLPGV